MNVFAQFARYILWVFNVAFLLIGVGLITIGSIMVSNTSDYSKFDDIQDPRTLPILTIILGAIVFIISFVGCCGAWKENTCCLTTYSVLMFLVFCLQFSLAVWMFVERETFLNNLMSSLKEFWDNNDEAHDYPMDVIQVNFKCCGFTGYDDYTSTVPSSCCGELKPKPGYTCHPDVYQSKPGCYQQYYDFWTMAVDVIRFGGIAFALVEILAFAFACCLISNVKKGRSY